MLQSLQPVTGNPGSFMMQSCHSTTPLISFSPYDLLEFLFLVRQLSSLNPITLSVRSSPLPSIFPADTCILLPLLSVGHSSCLDFCCSISMPLPFLFPVWIFLSPSSLFGYFADGDWLHWETCSPGLFYSTCPFLLLVVWPVGSADVYAASVSWHPVPFLSLLYILLWDNGKEWLSWHVCQCLVKLICLVKCF